MVARGQLVEADSLSVFVCGPTSRINFHSDTLCFLIDSTVLSKMRLGEPNNNLSVL